MNYGVAIRKIRKEHGLNQITFCQEIGVTQAYLSQIESNKLPPSREMLERISYNFNVTMAEIMLISTTVDDLPKQFYDRWEEVSTEALSLLRSLKN